MVTIPRDRLTIRFARSGGPGGQNVNKVSTKVEVRFLLGSADWIPEPVRRRVEELFAARINQAGEFAVSSSRFRSQSQNLEDCLHKLEAILETAGRRRKRRLLTRPTTASRERRLLTKRARSEQKRGRSWRGEE